MSADNDTPEHRRDWFSVERRVFDDEMFAGDPFSRRDAWLWLIANAAKRDHTARTRGGMLALKRGEVIVGRDHLAKVWKWTPSKVRTFLDQLCAADRLEYRQSNGHHPNVAKIKNYRRFQDFHATSSPVKSPVEPPEDRQSVASGSPHHYKEQEDIDKTGTRKTAPRIDRSILDAALGDFNNAALAIGFSRCTSLTDQRAKALAKRLADIGQGDLERGAERFRDALTAIPHEPFLAGKTKPRPGGKPFRLDLDRLLSTGSGMGDVLAKLIDLHAEHGPARAAQPAASKAKQQAAFDDVWNDAQAEELAAQRARYHGTDTTEATRGDFKH